MKAHCDICGIGGEHIPDDPYNSEIDLIGFMMENSEDSVAPKWMCQSCYEAFQSINPEATAVNIKHED